MTGPPSSTGSLRAEMRFEPDDDRSCKWTSQPSNSSALRMSSIGLTSGRRLVRSQSLPPNASVQVYEHNVFLMLVQIQEDLERLDGGASAYVYAVNDQVVLKSPVTYVLPTYESSQYDRYEYALHTVCHHEDIENERAILRILQRVPHGNIVQVIALEHPEGIYLRRYSPLSRRLQTEKPVQSIRITWYRDMLRALVHLHQLEIAHADVRLDNFLCDSYDTMVLCDFTCSRRFGQENPSAGGITTALSVNGFSPVVSDATDRFALASVIFEIEMGAKPILSLLSNTLQVPTVNTGNENLDLIIEKAWLKKYRSTMDMLGDIESLLDSGGPMAGVVLHIAAIENLRAQIEDWRRTRTRKYGKIPFNRLLFVR